MKDFLNTNGLVRGRIPPGKSCPFYQKCSYKNKNCPTKLNPSAKETSCDVARLCSMNTNDPKLLNGKWKG